MILAEDTESVKVIENPLAKTQPVDIRQDEIETRTKSPNSIMPQGLLDKLSREEILDLLAYVYARGNEQHEFFQNAGAHGHVHDHGH
jgi:hypothetical protein